jgi:hypothetical protein
VHLAPHAPASPAMLARVPFALAADPRPVLSIRRCSGPPEPR